MLLPTFLSASALALTANAFLVPLEVKEQNSAPIDTASFALQSQSILLDCSSCPFALKKDQDGTLWKQGVQNDLVMDFTAEDKSLQLNGVPFYPIAMPPLPPAISVHQTRTTTEDDSTLPMDSEPLRLSYSLEFEKEKATKGPEDPVLIQALMTVMGLEGQMIRVDNIEIKALKSSNGEVSLACCSKIQSNHSTNPHQLQLVSVDQVTPSPSAPDAKCSTIMCRVFTKIAAKLHAAGRKIKHICMKCLQRLQALKHHGRPTPPTMPKLPDMPSLPNIPTSPDSFELPSHHHFKIGHHHGHHSWVHKLAHGTKKAFAFIILPVLIGIAFGLAASAVGMLVGQIVVFFWLRRRRNDAQYEAVETDDKEEGLPAYEELTAVEVGDEKEGLVERV